MRRFSGRSLQSFLIQAMMVGVTIIAVFPLFHVFGFVISKGIHVLSLPFFTELPRPVGELGGGLGHAFLGTLILMLMALAMSLPVGLGVGILMSEFPDQKGVSSVRTAVDLLSSIPSIVLGLFVYAAAVKPFGGFSAHAGAVALSLIMIPMLAKITEEMLKLVHPSVREAGLALGLTRTQVILRIVVQGSMKSILVGVILSLARISGETAPLLFTAFASQNWFQGLGEPIASVPVALYTYAVSPYEDWQDQAWGAALVLILFVLVLNLFVKFFFQERKAKKR